MTPKKKPKYIQNKSAEEACVMPPAFSAKMYSWVLMIILLLVVGLIRYRLLDVPLERDEGEYAYGAQIVLDGKLPIQYIYSMKFPGIYYAYAVLLKIFGQTAYGIHTGLLCVNLLTVAGIFLLARRLLLPLGAAAAAAVFAVVSLSQYVDGVMANAEHFVIFFAIYGILVLLKALSSGRLIMFFLSGLLLGASGVMKQHGIFFCIFAVLYLIYETGWKQTHQKMSPFCRLILLVGGMLIVLILLVAPILCQRQFQTLWFWMVTCSDLYINQMPIGKIFSVFLLNFDPVFNTAALFFILASGGIFLLVRPGIDRKKRLFFVSYAGISFLAVCPGFYFRSHYFVLLLPSVGLLAGLTIDRINLLLARKYSFQIQQAVLLILCTICIGQPLYSERDFFFQLTPIQASRKIFGLNPFPESVVVADYLKTHTESAETVAILGSEPQIFFYAQRCSATPYIYMYPLMQAGPLALQMQQEMIENIESRNPRYVIFVDVPTSWDHTKKSHNLIWGWFAEYQKKNLKLVGTVVLGDESVYRWGDEVQWPINHPGWLAVFEKVPVAMNVNRRCENIDSAQDFQKQ